MAEKNGPASSGRSHIVLIPGFGGFDALGQMEYYSGVTRLFARQKAGGQVVLHYFDNFPTAAVATRASRLRSYLAKRRARGEIADGDEVTLVGHSTGGLDIRMLLWDLHRRKQPLRVDGGVPVHKAGLLDCIRRVVFLSVPHWGTNIADWVRSHSLWRKVVVTDLRAAVAASQVPGLDLIERGTVAGAAQFTDSGLLRALEDCLGEADEYTGRRTPERVAAAHEAASELALYLRHMASDFAAIDDLASLPGDGASPSPAHFDSQDRIDEQKLWRDLRLDVQSYVTLGNRPFDFAPGRPAPVWDLANPWTYPELSKDGTLSRGTDYGYRMCYRACAGGPFRRQISASEVTAVLNGPYPQAIELWDNDGIVNTGSMFWPAGDNILVYADHMDIVGHHKLTKRAHPDARRYQSYDLLDSDSGFDDDVFEDVWNEILAFSAGKKEIPARERARPAFAGA